MQRSSVTIIPITLGAAVNWGLEDLWVAKSAGVNVFASMKNLQ